jgi:hypothetical protein
MKHRHLRVCWCGAISLTRNLLFIFCAASRQRSHSRLRFSRETLPYFTVPLPLRTVWPSYTVRHYIHFPSPSTIRWATVKVDSLSRLSSQIQSQSYVTTDVHSARQSWNKASISGKTRYLCVRELQACWCATLSLTESSSDVISLLSVGTIFILQVIKYILN